MGTLQRNFGVFNKWCNVTVSSIKLVWGASPFLFILLLVLIPLQGILPAIAIVFSKNIANDLSAIMANHKLLVDLYPLVEANVVIWVVLLVVAYLLAPISTAIQGIMNDRLSGYLTLKMMYKTSEFEGIEYFESPTYHDQLEIIRRELAWRPVNLLVFLVNDLRNLVAIISVMTLIYTFIPYLVIILVASMLPQAIASMQLQRSAFEAIVERSPNSRRLQYFANVMLNVEYAKEVRLFNLQSFFIRQYRTIFHSVHLALSKVRLKQAVISGILSILGVCGVGISFYVVVQRSIYGSASIGELILFLQSITYAQQGMTEFVQETALLADTIMYMETLVAFLSIPKSDLHPKIERDSGSHEQVKEQLLVMDDVSFTYPNGQCALLNVSVAIHEEEMVAIVGENGAGKSTLVKLITQLYQPSSGRLYFKGKRAQDVPIELYREHFSTVFQDFAKFHVSLRDNIRMGRIGESVTDERLREIIQLSGLEDVIESTPDGLDVILGREFDGGIELSGGQWQRVAIARAFLRDAPIVLLDEPSAALDARAEYDLFSRLRRLAAGKTVLFITHRLASVTMADRVIVLREGRVLDVGSHEELMGRSSYYAEMFHLQAERYRPY